MTVAKSLVRAVIMGPPGSGKGTIAKRIVKDFGLTHLASGDILRKQVSDATPVGLQAQKYIASGLLVPDDVMMKLVLGELNSKCFQIKRFIITLCNILFVWNLYLRNTHDSIHDHDKEKRQLLHCYNLLFFFSHPKPLALFP